MLSRPALSNGLALRTATLCCLFALLFASGCQFGGGGHGGGGGGGNGGGGNGGGGGGGQQFVAIGIQSVQASGFTTGGIGTFTVNVSNFGNRANNSFTTVSAALGAAFTIAPGSGGGSGSAAWDCAASIGAQVTCTSNASLAPGSSAPPLTINVNVSSSASGSGQITFNVANSDGVNSGSANFPANYSVTGSSGGGPAVVSSTIPFPVFAGDGPTAIPIAVTNDAPNDTVTAGLSVDDNTSFNCTLATCGSLGTPTPVGAAGSGSYTVSYTPPASSPSFVQTMPRITISSSLSGSTPDIEDIEVDPAGILVTVDITPIRAGYAFVGANPPDTRTVTVTVYNDVTHAGATIAPLTATGYACATLTMNSCGAMSPPSAPSFSGNTTTITATYTPPTAVPSPPYNKPLVRAISTADNMRFGESRLLVTNDNFAPSIPPIWIARNAKFRTAFAGAAATTMTARVFNDAGPSKTIHWTLTAGGTTCSPACGMLSSLTTGGGGTNVVSTIAYTPPASAPTGAAANPTITAASADTPSETDSFSFNILDPTCGTGHESVLNGQYAFLLHGGAAGGGYLALIGSFTADGAGRITGGRGDFNSSNLGTFLDAALLTAPQGSLPASSYSVGPDNRGCLTLTDNTGGFETFRFAVGTLDASSHATQGRIVRFDDVSWVSRSQSGVIYRQDSTSFTASALSGTYADGFTGVDANGGRFASAGVFTADGAGNLTGISSDVNDAGTTGTLTGSGTYIVANPADGRFTATTTTTATPGGMSMSHSVFYMVSASHALFMSTDLSSTGQPIQSGEIRKQTGAPFAATTLDAKDYVFHVEGIHPGDGGNDTVLGQTTFTSNGSATITLDENKSGVMQTEQTLPVQFLVGPTGRTTISGLPAGSSPPVLYLIDSTSAFIVGTSNGAESGFVEQQVGAPFSNASFSGQYIFGADAPTTAARYQSGTVNLGAGNVTGNGDVSSPSGLTIDAITPANGGTYCISSSCSPAISTPVGRGIIGAGQPNPSIAYAVSASKIIFMSTGTDVDLFVVQK